MNKTEYETSDSHINEEGSDCETENNFSSHKPRQQNHNQDYGNNNSNYGGNNNKYSNSSYGNSSYSNANYTQGNYGTMNQYGKHSSMSQGGGDANSQCQNKVSEAANPCNNRSVDGGGDLGGSVWQMGSSRSGSAAWSNMQV